jgi:hypothetical protein
MKSSRFTCPCLPRFPSEVPHNVLPPLCIQLAVVEPSPSPRYVLRWPAVLLLVSSGFRRPRDFRWQTHSSALPCGCIWWHLVMTVQRHRSEPLEPLPPVVLAPRLWNHSWSSPHCIEQGVYL